MDVERVRARHQRKEERRKRVWGDAQNCAVFVATGSGLHRCEFKAKKWVRGQGVCAVHMERPDLQFFTPEEAIAHRRGALSRRRLEIEP